MFPFGFRACPWFVHHQGLSERQHHFARLYGSAVSRAPFHFHNVIGSLSLRLGIEPADCETWRNAVAYRSGQVVTNVALSQP